MYTPDVGVLLVLLLTCSCAIALFVSHAATSACASSSPNFDENLQNDFLRQIREELFDIQERCSVTSWPLPVGSLASSSSSQSHVETSLPDLSFLSEGEDDGYEERLGWMPLLLKIHQTFASLLLPPLSCSSSCPNRKHFGLSHNGGSKEREKGEQEDTQERGERTAVVASCQGDSKKTSPCYGEGSRRGEEQSSQFDRQGLRAGFAKVVGGSDDEDVYRIQSNEFEISSLWQLIQAQASTGVEGAGDEEEQDRGARGGGGGGARLRSGSGGGGGGARVDGAPIPGRLPPPHACNTHGFPPKQEKKIALFFLPVYPSI